MSAVWDDLAPWQGRSGWLREDSDGHRVGCVLWWRRDVHANVDYSNPLPTNVTHARLYFLPTNHHTPPQQLPAPNLPPQSHRQAHTSRPNLSIHRISRKTPKISQAASPFYTLASAPNLRKTAKMHRTCTLICVRLCRYVAAGKRAGMFSRVESVDSEQARLGSERGGGGVA